MGKHVDKFISAPFWKQIGILLFFLIVSGAVFWCLGHVLQSNEKDPYVTEMDKLKLEVQSIKSESQPVQNEKIGKSGSAWYIISRLIDPGYIGESETEWYSFIITIFGWLCCTVFLIALITNAYEVRIEKIKNGLVRYSFKNHYVIIGHNEMTVGIIKKIRAGKLDVDKDSAIIVHSQCETSKLRSFLKERLSDQEEKHLYFYRGERETREQLDPLHLNKAKIVFILGEQNEIGVDSGNVECVNIIKEIKKASSEKQKEQIKKLPCYLFLKEQTTFKLLQQYDMEIEIHKYIELQTFNLYENWARMVLSGEKLSGEQNYSIVFDKVAFDKTKKDLRFLILGFNRMEKALAIQTARVAHFGNGQKTLITIIDKNARELENSFLSKYPGLKSMQDIGFDFIEDLADSKETRKKIEEWAQKDELLTAAVCFRNPDTSLFIGLDLPRIVYGQKVPVLIRQEYLHGFASSINKSPVFEKVNFFGMLSDTCNFDFHRDDYAKSLHEAYLKELESFGKRDLTKPSHQDWEYLPEQYRWSNRYPVDIYPVKQKVLKKLSNIYDEGKIEGYLQLLKDVMRMYFENASKNESARSRLWDSLSPEGKNVAKDIDIMAKIEHERWISEKVLAGWSYATERYENLLRHLHPDLVPFEELSEEKKMYDRTPSIKMFELKLGSEKGN